MKLIVGADIAGPHPKRVRSADVSGTRGRGRPCLLRRKEFLRFGDTVEAVQGGPLMLTYWQITSAATPASRSLNASEYGNGNLRSACSRALSSSAI